MMIWTEEALEKAVNLDALSPNIPTLSTCKLKHCQHLNYHQHMTQKLMKQKVDIDSFLLNTQFLKFLVSNSEQNIDGISII